MSTSVLSCMVNILPIRNGNMPILDDGSLIYHVVNILPIRNGDGFLMFGYIIILLNPAYMESRKIHKIPARY